VDRKGKMNRRNPLLPCALLFVLSLVGVSARAADSPASSSPEFVVQSYLQAVQSGQYLAVAELMHPEALEKFQAMMLPLVEEAEGADQPEVLLLFRGVSDVAALKKLSRAELFAAFFGGVTDLNPGVKEVLASGSLSITPIGSVPEGDILHLLCRTAVSMDGINLNKMEVVSLKRSTGSWRVLLSGEMEGIAQAMRNAISGKK
jgi:hypothetical protein